LNPAPRDRIYAPGGAHLHGAPPRQRSLLQRQVTAGYWLLIAVGILNLPVLYTLSRFGLLSQQLTAAAAGAAVFIVLAIYVSLRNRATGAAGIRKFRLGLPGLLLLIFVLQIGLSNLVNIWSGNRQDGQDIWLRYVMTFHPVLLFFAFKDLASDARAHLPLTRIFDVLTAGLAFSVLLSLWNLYQAESYGSRQFGILGDQVSWLLSAVLIANLAQGKRLLCGLAALALLATGSRGAIIVTIAALLLYTFVARERDVRTALSKISTVAAAGTAVLLSEGLLSFLLERFYLTDIGNNDRISTTLFTLSIFREFPFVGAGLNAHSYFFEAYGYQPSPYELIFSTPVSSFAQVLADGGLLGGFIFAGFIAAMGVTSWQVMRWRWLKLVPKGESDQFRAMCSGLAAWSISFLVLNQSATYFLPTSMIGELAFIILGCVVGCWDWQTDIAKTLQSPRGAARSSPVFPTSPQYTASRAKLPRMANPDISGSTDPS